MRTSPSALLLLFACPVAGQVPFPWLPPASGPAAHGKHTIAVEAGTDINSNAVYNELAWAILRGDTLSRAVRENSRAALRTRNSATSIGGLRVEWTGAPGLFGQRHWRPVVAFATKDVSGLRFTPDLYSTVFFGNAQFEGRRADLGPSASLSMAYQSLGTGVRLANSRSFVRLDAVMGQYLTAADVDWAGVHTGYDGRMLRADLLGEVLTSDSAGAGFGRNNGLGAALNGCWETRLHGRWPTRIAFILEDFGFIRWNGESLRMERDTTVEYSGVEVADVFGLDDALIGGEQLLDTFGLRFNKGAFTTWLPFRAGIALEQPVGEHWTVSASLDQRNLPGYVPHAMLGASWRFRGGWLAGAGIAYGGGGVLRWPVIARAAIRDRIGLWLGSPNLPGFALGTTRGFGVQGGLSFAF